MFKRKPISKDIIPDNVVYAFLIRWIAGESGGSGGFTITINFEKACDRVDIAKRAGDTGIISVVAVANLAEILEGSDIKDLGYDYLSDPNLRTIDRKELATSFGIIDDPQNLYYAGKERPVITRKE